MATVDDLSVRVSAQTADFSAGMNVAERGLSSLRSDALQTAGAMQMLQGRMDEAGDEAQTAGAKAGASSGGFLSAAGAAAGAEVSFGSLSVMTIGTLIPSLLALSTVVAPLVAALGGFVTVAGSIAGVGLAGFIGAVATNGEMLQETFNELVSTIKTEFAPVFDTFAVVLDALMNDLIDIIPELVPAQHVIEQIATNFDLLGVAIVETLPAFVELATELTDRFLPPFARWANDVLPRIPGMLEGLIPTMLEVGSALGPMVDSLVEIAPTMTEFGMTVLNIVIPALTTFLDWWNRGMQVVNQMEQSVGTLTTKLIILGPIIAGLASTFGGPLVSVLTTVGGLLGGTMLTGLTTLLGPLSGVGAAIGSVAGSISAFLAPLTSAIGTVGSFAGTLGAVLGPIGLLLAAIGTLGWVVKNNQQVIARFANRAITLLQNVVRDAATWISENGPTLIQKGFRAIGEGIRFVALDIYNALTGNDDSILRSIITDFGSWLINKGPGVLKSAIGTALDVIWSAAQGLYQGLIGGSLFPDMFKEIANYMANKVPSMLANGAIKAVSTIFAIYQSGFNRIANFIAGIWNGISEMLINGMESVVSNIVSGLNGVIGKINSAIKKYNKAVPKEAHMDTMGTLSAPDLNAQAANLQSNRTTDVGQLQQQNEQTIRVVLDEQTDVVEGRIQEGAERVVETRERRTQRNSGRNPNPN